MELAEAQQEAVARELDEEGRGALRAQPVGAGVAADASGQPAFVPPAAPGASTGRTTTACPADAARAQLAYAKSEGGSNRRRIVRSPHRRLKVGAS